MSLKSLLRQNCTYSMYSGIDEYGNLAHSSPQTLKCRFAKSGLKLSQFGQGEISQNSASLWLDNSFLPSNNDKVVVGGAEYLVKFVDQWVEGNGRILGYKLTIEEYA